MKRYRFDATWAGETLHENDCMVPGENGDWVRYIEVERLTERVRELESIVHRFLDGAVFRDMQLDLDARQALQHKEEK